MKKGLLFLVGLAMSFTMMAQTTFPVKFTPADGLPEQTTAAANSFKDWMSPVLTFDEPVTSFRMTVTHTSWQDAYCVNHDGGKGYVFFTLGEFYLKDAAGNDIKLGLENFSSNAYASNNDGSWEGLFDGDISTHFHTCYSATDQPRPIGAEHYLEVTLPEPMKSFQFGFYKRSNNANIPSEIILTAGGVAADPYPEFGFQLGDKVEAVEPNNLYVLADEGFINSDAWEGQMTTYLATGRDPRYSSPEGTDTRYRIRRVANADCVFKAIPAEDDQFYLYSFIGESFVASVAESAGSSFIDQTLELSSAAKFHLDEEGYLVCNNHYYALNSQETLVAYDHAVRKLSFFKASINSALLVEDLKKDIAKGDEAITKYKQLYADQNADQGETAALEEALETAKALNAESEPNAILAAQSDLQTATVEFLKVRIYLFVDEINGYLDESLFDNTVGNYPSIWEGRLASLLETVQNDIDTRTFAMIDECSSYINSVQAEIDEFLASKIEGYTEWPMTIVAPDGQNQLGSLVNYPNESSNADKYVYNSPTFIFEEPVEQFFVTFVNTNDGDSGGGWPCTALANFAVFDDMGKEVDLVGDDFYCNAPEVDNADDTQPLSNLCDKNDDGTPNVSTYFHTKWSTRDISTNEHYLCVTLPQSLSCFSFQYITRGKGIAPKEIVVGREPYHYIPPELAEIKGQITSVTELDPEKYYILWGNINRVDKGQEGSGYYAGISKATGDVPYFEGVFQVIPTENAGYKIHFVKEDYYLDQPGGWSSAASTPLASNAGEYFFAESENLQDAFKIYAYGMYEGTMNRIVLQDWSGGLGWFPIGTDEDGFERDDTDGESDWYIYETKAPRTQVAVKDVTKASELNTTDEYLMWGNIDVLSKGVKGSGYYRGKDLDGTEATNFNIFNLEKGANGGYKIHFKYDDVYLKNMTSWTSAEVTTDPNEAGEWFFEESTRMEGAFWIYTKGKFTGQNASKIDYVDADAMFRLQDWGEHGAGVYPIVTLSEDDTDGESDWTIRKVWDPSTVVLNREDYLGDYTWTYDYYWDDHHIERVPVTIEADPNSEDGIVINNFYETGCPLVGTFDGEQQNITFQPMQVMNSDESYTYIFRSTASEDSPIIFKIDLMNDCIKYLGQAGFIYRNNNFDPSQPEDDDNWLYKYWKQLSYTYVELVPEVGPDGVENLVVEGNDLISTEFYNLKGQRISAPEKGMNIIRRTYDNGVISVQKVLVR